METLTNLRENLSVGLLKIVLASYVLFTSIMLVMLICHIFGTSHSKVLWQIETVPILTGYLTMAVSALKCYLRLSFLRFLIIRF